MNPYVASVRPLDNHRLDILFENGEPHATAVGAMPKGMLERELGLEDEVAA